MDIIPKNDDEIEPNYTGQQSGKGIQGKPIHLRNLQHENVEKTQPSSTSFDAMLILLINNYTKSQLKSSIQH
jgi:hypothetical protein